MRNGGQAVFDAASKGEGEGFMDPTIIKAGEQLAEFGKLEPFQRAISAPPGHRRSVFLATAKRR